MKSKRRKLLPSPAMIVAIFALIVALAGTALASGVINKKKVNKIISNRAPGLSVAQAKNADNLGGVGPGGYQGFCKAGAIKGSLVIDPTGFASTTFQNVTGYNCFQPGNTTSSVQMKLLPGPHPGYQVRFVGNKGPDASGSAVCSGLNEGESANCRSEAGASDAPGETIFDVQTTTGGTTANNEPFSLVAF